MRGHQTQLQSAIFWQYAEDRIKLVFKEEKIEADAETETKGRMHVAQTESERKSRKAQSPGRPEHVGN